MGNANRTQPPTGRKDTERAGAGRGAHESGVEGRVELLAIEIPGTRIGERLECGRDARSVVELGIAHPGQQSARPVGRVEVEPLARGHVGARSLACHLSTHHFPNHSTVIPRHAACPLSATSCNMCHPASPLLPSLPLRYFLAVDGMPLRHRASAQIVMVIIFPPL